MAKEYTLQEMLADNDFQRADRETQRQLLNQYDPKFRDGGRDVQDRFLDGYAKRIATQTKQAGKIGGEMDQRLMLKAEPIIRAETAQEQATARQRANLATVAQTGGGDVAEAGSTERFPQNLIADPTQLLPTPGGVARRAAAATGMAGLSEGAGAIGRLLLRRGPGGVQRIGERAATGTLGALEGHVPGSQAAARALEPGGVGTRIQNFMGFGAPRKSISLFNLATHEGSQLSDQTWRQAGQAADAAVQARGGQLGSRQMFQIWGALRDSFTSSPAAKTNEGVQMFLDRYGRGGSFTVEQARNLISDYRGLMSNMGEGSLRVDASRLAQGARQEMYQQIEQLAGPQIAQAVRASDAQKAAAVALYGTRDQVGILGPDVFDPKGILDIGKLSTKLARDRGEIIDKIGIDAYNQLVQIVQPGAFAGQRSVIVPGSNEATRGLRTLISGRGGMGSVVGAGSGAAEVLPGAVNQLRGQHLKRGTKQNVASGAAGALGAFLAGERNESSLDKSKRQR